MMLAGPQLVAGPAAAGGERARLLSLYVQDYLECVESLPLDIQRNASLLREMDTQCQGGRRRGLRLTAPAEGGVKEGGPPPASRTCARRGGAGAGPAEWGVGAGGAALPGARPRLGRAGPLPLSPPSGRKWLLWRPGDVCGGGGCCMERSQRGRGEGPRSGKLPGTSAKDAASSEMRVK